MAILTAKDVPKFGTIQGFTIPLFTKWKFKQSDLYINYEQWFEDIIEPCEYFNAIVYTASVLRIDKCRKLICSRLDYPDYEGKTKIRYGANIHSKIYYVNNGWFDFDIWIGSGNLVSSKGWHNTMMRVSEYNHKSLQLYFNRLWKLCSLNLIKDI